MKKIYRTIAITAASASVLALTACAVDPYYGSRPAPVYSSAPVYRPAPVYSAAPAYVQPQVYTEYGRVANIEVMQQEVARQPSGAGALIGGVLGAVVGNQIGHGGGRALATGVGLMGGAVAGNTLEGNQRGPVVQTYRVSIQVENGSTRTFDVPSPGDLRIGDRVRIQNNQLQRI
ncbi:glycine zipper 2TM domain-containing protein [Xylophilus sp. GOD-11R]|uniref:glycine zipper 2TM domain-containing protein n=1 Tax=Xylophilus sp. GOD-11R TaxID=3089814 RepID=UPI00298BE65F|nr:glycine zipper 2TM domain-containing protein [Xylophilus sp. GOD-11R]WPB58184.1 glycine zipper 2TM domain-containing protein [Xylophilus sp. GOD-11R]